MANNSWGDNSGNWTTPSDWSTGVVPGSADNVVVAQGDPQITTNVPAIGSLDDSSNVSLVSGGSLTDNGSLTIEAGGQLGLDLQQGQFGSSLVVKSALTNLGTFDIGSGLSGNNASTTVNVASINNNGGTINLNGDAPFEGSAVSELSVTGAASFGSVGILSGNVNLAGDSIIQFAGGQISSITGNLDLAGQASIADAGGGTNSALTGLSSVSGTADINGSNVNTNQNLNNTGHIVVRSDYIGNGAPPSSNLNIGGILNNGSVVDVGFGGTLTTKGLVNNATMSVNGGSIIVNGSTSGSGSIYLSNNQLESSYVEFAQTSSNNVAFTSANNTSEVVKLDNPAAGYTGQISGFATGDTLDLGSEVATISSYDGSTLTVQTANGAQSFKISGPAANGLEAISDGHGGTDIVVCFLSGTLIRTQKENLAVEALEVGDLVVTASGDLRPVRWIGHRTIDCRNHPRPQDVMPIRVAAHAFGADLPERDLYLSPGHPVLVGADEDGAGGHLVPIMCLINGTTVARAKVDAVTYWHVELDAHDILLAEGLPAESYIDLGSRPWFAGADGALYDPDMALPGMPGRCRPVAIDGPLVEAERRRLDATFAMRLASACAWPGAEDASLPL